MFMCQKGPAYIFVAAQLNFSQVQRFRFHNLRFHRFRAEPEPEPASCQNKVQMSSVEAQDMKTQNLL